MQATANQNYPLKDTLEQLAENLKRIEAVVDKTSEQMKETDRRMEETDRMVKETSQQIKETDRQMKETSRQMKETDRQMKRTNKRMGFITNRFGELAEHLVAPNIHTRFNELGHFFSEAAPRGYKVYDDKGKTLAEIDLLLENGATIMVVEIKAKPVIEDIKNHIKRLEILRDSRRKKNDKRKIQGAIAGAILGTTEKKAIAEAGLYVIEQSGDTMKIDIPEDFIPKNW
jgi:hypothetical protein